MTYSMLADGIVWLAAGAVLGAVYFFLLGCSVSAIGRAGDWRGAAVFFVARIALAAGVFAVAAMQGAAALLFALGGFLLARMVTVARIKGGA